MEKHKTILLTGEEPCSADGKPGGLAALDPVYSGKRSPACWWTSRPDDMRPATTSSSS